MKSTWLIGSLLLCFVGSGGCGDLTPGPEGDAGSNPGTSDGGGGGSDGGGRDMGGGSPGLNLCKGAGCVGATCTRDSDCTEGSGMAAVCWRSNLRNNDKYLSTPGGYCSRPCTRDEDCGTGRCSTIPGEAQSFCFARCADANTCRKPGYVCLYDGPSALCYPGSNLECDPTQGSCDAKLADGTLVAGGCIRAAYENRGLCRVACQVGTRTCPADTVQGAGNPIPQHCVYLDMSRTSAGQPSPNGDKWRGAVCLAQGAAPKMAGQRCDFWDECADGLQCNRYEQVPDNRVCRPLCAQVNGQQSGGVYVPPGAMPASNTCAEAGATCKDALRAGVQNGNPGLCLK